jgi:PAS domain S-box-containing protein
MTTERTTRTTRTTVKPHSRKKNGSSTPTAEAPSSAELLLPAAFLELAPDSIVVADSAGHILLVNHQTEVLFGYDRSLLIGRPVETLLPPRVHAIHERHRAHYGAAPHTRPMGTNLDLYGRRQDGTEFPVEVSLSPLPSSGDLLVIAIVRDVTERARLEKEARVASQRRLALLQTVLDKLPGGAYLVRGPEARLVLANRAATEVWGASWGEGLSLSEFLCDSGVRYLTAEGQPLPLEQMITLQIVHGGPTTRQQRETVRRLDGTHLPILLSAVAIEGELLGEDASSGAERAAVVLIQDISELQALEQLKDQFITVAAHELRTPLTAILGFASMLTVQTRLGRGPELADWQQEAIGEIEEASARMNTLVKDLLDATRIQAGRLELELAPLDLGATVCRCAARFQLSAQHHTISVQVPEEPVILEADGPRLDQVVGNLLGNAIKYSPQGGPISITVQVDHTSGWAEVRIQDAGIGIPADEQSLLFGRFVRASNVHDYHIPGTGLGLYVCRELVERHGGHIWFESGEGVGTTFFIALPLAALHRESPQGN